MQQHKVHIYVEGEMYTSFTEVQTNYWNTQSTFRIQLEGYISKHKKSPVYGTLPRQGVRTFRMNLSSQRLIKPAGGRDDQAGG